MAMAMAMAMAMSMFMFMSPLLPLSPHIAIIPIFLLGTTNNWL